MCLDKRKAAQTIGDEVDNIKPLSSNHPHLKPKQMVYIYFIYFLNKANWSYCSLLLVGKTYFTLYMQPDKVKLR